MEILHIAEHMGYQVLIAWFSNTGFGKFLHILLIIIISVRLTQQTSQSSWALQEVFQRYNGVNQRALVSTEGKAGGDNKNRQSATKHDMRLEGYHFLFQAEDWFSTASLSKLLESLASQKSGSTLTFSWYIWHFSWQEALSIVQCFCTSQKWDDFLYFHCILCSFFTSQYSYS